MIFRKAVLFLAAAIATTTIAHAQLGVYGTVSVDRLGGIASSPEPDTNNNGARNNSVLPLGGTAGVYYDFLKLGPVRLGADLRGTLTSDKRGAYSDFSGGGARLYSGLAGVRAVFHTPYSALRPYIQGSAGIARTNYGLLYNEAGITSTGGIVGNSIVLHSNFQVQGFAGVDYRLLPFMDFRVVEVGYGVINPFGATAHNYPVGTISSGVVFHLPF
jgi:hypothetical protein